MGCQYQDQYFVKINSILMKIKTYSFVCGKLDLSFNFKCPQHEIKQCIMRANYRQKLFQSIIFKLGIYINEVSKHKSLNLNVTYYIVKKYVIMGSC